MGEEAGGALGQALDGLDQERLESQSSGLAPLRDRLEEFCKAILPRLAPGERLQREHVVAAVDGVDLEEWRDEVEGLRPHRLRFARLAERVEEIAEALEQA